jgi:hypothetical protein
MRARPRWIVVWGPETRFYWAVPLFAVPDWLWPVFHPDPRVLVARMDEIERVFGRRRTGRGGGQEC